MVAVCKERSDAAHGTDAGTMHRVCGATDGGACMVTDYARRLQNLQNQTSALNRKLVPA